MSSKTKKAQIKIEFENDSYILTDEIKTEVLEKKLKLEPPSWSLILDNIREMRKGRDAPVDNMGCDKCMDESAPTQVFMPPKKYVYNRLLIWFSQTERFQKWSIYV